MIRKLTLAVGFGAGYVLGAKAGKERYAQIEAKFRELMGQPAVQDLTEKATTTASAAADKAKSTVNEKVEAVSDKVSSSGSSSSGSTGAPTPPSTSTSGIGTSGIGASGIGTTSSTATPDTVADEVVVVDLAPTTTPATGPIGGARPSGTAPDVL